jgi:hypothetical protein
MTDWLLLVYKVPSEPSARRVYVWRKLKRVGAILLHDSAWVLPATSRSREHLQWLSAEIVEMGGEALLWDAAPLITGQSETLRKQFEEQTTSAYQEILTALADPAPDLVALSQRYQQTKANDYFDSALEAQVREALISARGDSKP